MDINKQTLGVIPHKENGLPVGIDEITELLCLEYKRGNVYEENKDKWVEYIQNMAIFKHEDPVFVEQTRELFKNASHLDTNNSDNDDELNDQDIKELNNYKNNISNNYIKDWDYEKAKTMLFLFR